MVGLKPAAELAGSGQHSKPKATQVHCRYASPDCPSAVPGDQALAPFCWPLGPEHQSPKEFMAPEVRANAQHTSTLLRCQALLPPPTRGGSALPCVLTTTPACGCMYAHAQDFMFTLTQGDGSRLQGFCRRFLPPAPRVGSKLRYPQVLCLICEAAWAAFFFKASCQQQQQQHNRGLAGPARQHMSGCAGPQPPCTLHMLGCQVHLGPHHSMVWCHL